MNELTIKYSEINISNDKIYKLKKAIPQMFELTKDYKSDATRKQSLLSKYMIVNNLNCKEEDIYYNALKKPFVKNSYFNVSHSKNLIVFVKAKKEIGIDVELINDKHLNIINRAFTNKEINFIQDRIDILDSIESRFTLLWTIKESLFKASGTEKYIEPKEIEVTFDDMTINSKNVILNHIFFLDIDYNVYSFKYHDYIISVASIDKFEDIQLDYQDIL